MAMSKKNVKRRLDDSRRATHNDLLQVASLLHGSSHERIQLDLLYKNMQGALHWAVECWLGEPARLGWHDQEARFLRMAPDELRARYLHVAGRTTRLMTDLHDQLGDDDIEQVVITAPSLADWRERAMHWHSEAEELVGFLTGSTGNAAKRIERGDLRGAPDGLTPCLLLARSGIRRGRWLDAGPQAGLFHFGEIREIDSSSRSPNVHLHEGMILPLSLCRDAPLQRKLLDFAQLVMHPMTEGPASGRLIDASQRRAELQAWLSERELGCLRLLDKEPTFPWVRFEPTAKAFLGVLSHCEYVTAVSDERSVSTRVLEHAAFQFKSHGELLEWAGLHAHPSECIEPFSLFLSGDLAGVPDMLSDAKDRKTMFRPSEYAMRFSVPDVSVPSASVGVQLEHCAWVTLRITLGEQDIEIYLSDVFDPFPSLFEWLQAISMNDLPIGIEIDEEGSEKTLVAHEFDADRLLVAVLDNWDRTEFGAAVVERNAFLAAFRSELNDFLRDHK